MSSSQGPSRVRRRQRTPVWYWRDPPSPSPSASRPAQAFSISTIIEKTPSETEAVREPSPAPRACSPVEHPPVLGLPDPVLPSSVHTFEYGVSTSDAAATWCILRTLEIQHMALSGLCEAAGLPPLPPAPFQLGPDPLPHKAPWDLFPPWKTSFHATPEADPAITEDTAETDPVPDPPFTPLPAIEDEDMDLGTLFTDPPAHEPVTQMPPTSSSPTSVLTTELYLLEDIDWSQDDLLDDTL